MIAKYGLSALLIVLAATAAPSVGWTATLDDVPMCREENGGTLFACGSELRFKGGGVTAVPTGGRTEITVGSDYASVTAFGAVCDGVNGAGTNDATAIQATFDSLNSSSRGAVLFPPRECLSNTSIVSGVHAPYPSVFTTANTGGSLANSTSYCYSVTATAGGNETTGSLERCITTGGTGGAHTVTINWYAVAGATGYKLYGRTTGAGTDLMATWDGATWSVGSGTATSWTDTGSVTPSGNLPTLNTVTGAKSIAVYGYGQGISALTFTANTSGLSLFGGLLTEPITVKDLSILTSVASTGRALMIAHREILPGEASTGRAQVFVENVEIAPVKSSSTASWMFGLSLGGCWHCSISFVTYQGRGTTDSASGGETVSPVSGSHAIDIFGQSVDLMFSHLYLRSFDHGISCCYGGQSGAEAEGIQISNSYIIRGRVGIWADTLVNEPYLNVNSSHINTADYWIYGNNRVEMNVNGNLFYKTNTDLATLTDFPGIDATDCLRCAFTSNQFEITSGGAVSGRENALTLRVVTAGDATSIIANDNVFMDADGSNDGMLFVDASTVGVSAQGNRPNAGVLWDAASPSLASVRSNFNWLAYTFANLPAVGNGSQEYCSDCTYANPCAGSGTGAIWKRINNAHRCD